MSTQVALEKRFNFDFIFLSDYQLIINIKSLNYFPTQKIFYDVITELVNGTKKHQDKRNALRPQLTTRLEAAAKDEKEKAREIVSYFFRRPAQERNEIHIEEKETSADKIVDTILSYAYEPTVSNRM